MTSQTTDHSRAARAQRAVALAETLLSEALAGETRDEVAQSRRLARMMEDPHGKALTIAITDQAFRSRRPEPSPIRSPICSTATGRRASWSGGSASGSSSAA